MAKHAELCSNYSAELFNILRRFRTNITTATFLRFTGKLSVFYIIRSIRMNPPPLIVEGTLKFVVRRQKF